MLVMGVECFHHGAATNILPIPSKMQRLHYFDFAGCQQRNDTGEDAQCLDHAGYKKIVIPPEHISLELRRPRWDLSEWDEWDDVHTE